jgi:2-polyprenyl-3-methyl-5-hydroxy-6-metoxy-1,4-benzoquinol methylase
LNTASDSLSSLSQQQKETREFFDRFAQAWQAGAQATGEDGFNLVKHRNTAVHLARRHLQRVTRFLDIGCGSGELCFEMAEAGVDAVGIDFSSRMIALCQERQQALKQSRVQFLRQSIFDYRAAPESFELIASLGLVEYLSGDELAQLLEMCWSMLREKGLLVLGSRNRLFNLVTFNDYTRAELDAGTVADLMSEAIALMTASDQTAALEALSSGDKSLPPLASHPDTGIEVATRHQYTPRQLTWLLSRQGLHVEHIYGVHYHGVPPCFSQSSPQVHGLLANSMQDAAYYHQELIPFCSTFVLQACKTTG